MKETSLSLVSAVSPACIGLIFGVQDPSQIQPALICMIRLCFSGDVPLKCQRTVASEIIWAHPNLTATDLLKRYEEVRGRPLKFRGRLIEWLLPIPRVIVSDDDDERITMIPHDPPHSSPPDPTSGPDLHASDGDEPQAMNRQPLHLIKFKQILAKCGMTVALTYLWERFDSNQYSIWFCECREQGKRKPNANSTILIDEPARIVLEEGVCIDLRIQQRKSPCR